MYAVFKIGAHQYKVRSGDVIKVNRLEGVIGDEVKFDNVLMLSGDKPQVGLPYVSGASVLGVIKEHSKDKKIIVFKYKRRKNYKKKQGHRQLVSTLEIKDIAAQ